LAAHGVWRHVSFDNESEEYNVIGRLKLEAEGIAATFSD
jgi:hypothetical protein